MPSSFQTRLHTYCIEQTAPQINFGLFFHFEVAGFGLPIHSGKSSVLTGVGLLIEHLFKEIDVENCLLHEHNFQIQSTF